MRPRLNHKLSCRQGSIFILALWTIVVLSLLALSFAQTARQKALGLQKLERREALRAAGESAAKQVITHLLEAQRDPSFVKMKKWYDDGVGSGSVQVGAAVVHYQVTDEREKLNLNTVDAESLARLFQNVAHLGEEPAGRLAAAVIDFRDEDDFINTYFDQGSEKDSYERAGLPYAPKNREFDYAAELLLVKGMTGETYAAVAPFITVYGQKGVNINTAGRELLAALGVPPETADKIIVLRNGDDGIPNTPDDRAFEDLSQMMRLLADNEGLSEQEAVTLDSLVRHEGFTTKPDYFSLKLETLLEGSAPAHAVCIFGLKDGIRYWVDS